MMFQRGGQRRTIEAGCGWRCVGHPQEVNGKFKIHKKFCNTCKDSYTEGLPEFNKEGGKMNGWKGITNRGQQPNQMLTTALVNGEEYNIYTKASSMKEAMDETYLTANILAGAAEPTLSKSQKKRQKQKVKKLNDKDKNHYEDIIERLAEEDFNRKKGK